jgi:hypothetical protein
VKAAGLTKVLLDDGTTILCEGSNSGDGNSFASLLPSLPAHDR